MDQVALTFIPGVLVVRTGHPVEFRNSDDTLHNVRVNEVATKAGTFNVAIPMGEDYRFTFDREGFYDVGCDIHPAMSATIYASPSPYTALTDLERPVRNPRRPAGELQRDRLRRRRAAGTGRGSRRRADGRRFHEVSVGSEVVRPSGSRHQKLKKTSRSMPARSTRRNGDRTLSVCASEKVPRMRNSRDRWYSMVASSYSSRPN